MNSLRSSKLSLWRLITQSATSLVAKFFEATVESLAVLLDGNVIARGGVDDDDRVRMVVAHVHEMNPAVALVQIDELRGDTSL